MTHRTTPIAIAIVTMFMTLACPAIAQHIGPEVFEEPMVFDFSDAPTWPPLGDGHANPYESMGVEFTGYVANTTAPGIVGNHLASGFANTPPEPFVVRVRMLDNPALRVGGYVWPESGQQTSFTAFDDSGLIIDRIVFTGVTFTGLESPLGRPIRYVEWRSLAGADLTTFPRVDNIMIDVASVPEPTTMSLLATSGLTILVRRRRSRKSAY